MTKTSILRALVATACAAAVGFTPAIASAQFSKGGGYSVDGKKGPFIKQVSGRDFSGAGGGSLGLSDAINTGEYQAARLRMPETEKRVATFLAELDNQWPYAKRPIKVQILGLNQYNAMSLPDGSVVIAFGLLDQVQTDDELAFVLGHELGHIRLNHFAKDVRADKRASNMSKLGQAFLVGSALAAGASSVSNGASALAAVDAAAYAAGRRASAAEDMVHMLNDVMVPSSWAKAHEDEADTLGYDLSLADQYAADSAAAKVFDSIQADADNRAAQTEALNAKIKEELGKAAGEAAIQIAYSGGNISGAGLRNTLLKAGGKIALTAAVNRSDGASHRTPEQRKKGMADYTASAYPQGAPLVDERTTFIQQLRATKEYVDAKVTVAAVQNALKARVDGNYPGAQAELAKALQTGFRGAPLVLNESARLQDDMGNIDAAEQLFMAADRSPDQTVDGYIDHASMLLRAARYDRADQVIAEGTARFGNDDKPFISLQVAVADRSGKAERREQLMGRCAGYNDERLAKDCRLAARQEAKAEKVADKKPAIPGVGSVLGALPWKH